MELHLTLYKNYTFTITDHLIDDEDTGAVLARCTPLVEMDLIELESATRFFFRHQYRISKQRGVLEWGNACGRIAEDFIAYHEAKSNTVYPSVAKIAPL